jgi:hypothetical protein
MNAGESGTGGPGLRFVRTGTPWPKEFGEPANGAERQPEALKRCCEELLWQAEARVEKITLDAAGKPSGVEPLDIE